MFVARRNTASGGHDGAVKPCPASHRYSGNGSHDGAPFRSTNSQGKSPHRTTPIFVSLVVARQHIRLGWGMCSSPPQSMPPCPPFIGCRWYDSGRVREGSPATRTCP